MEPEDEDDVPTEISYKSSSEVDEDSIKAICSGNAYLLITIGRELLPNGHREASIKMGKGIDTLVEARDVLLEIVDQLDLAMLEFGEGG